MVSVREAEYQQAAKHLAAARKPLPGTQVTALDNITYRRLALVEANCHEQRGKRNETVKVLRESLRYLKRQKVLKPVLDELQKQVKELSS